MNNDFPHISKAGEVKGNKNRNADIIIFLIEFLLLNKDYFYKPTSKVTNFMQQTKCISIF